MATTSICGFCGHLIIKVNKRIGDIGPDFYHAEELKPNCFRLSEVCRLCHCAEEAGVREIKAPDDKK
jgi:hypothetical protein